MTTVKGEQIQNLGHVAQMHKHFNEYAEVQRDTNGQQR